MTNPDLCDDNLNMCISHTFCHLLGHLVLLQMPEMNFLSAVLLLQRGIMMKT